ncbi:MAG: hypothetical protein WC444_01015 [Candidatus Paceibacterota bacterium]
MNNNKIGLLFAVLIGGLHAFWSLLVFLNLGQSFFDVIFWAHMITPMFSVGQFNGVASLTLIVCTTLIGYLFGFVISVLWNRLHSDAQ